jgi:hypothetical protein
MDKKPRCPKGEKRNRKTGLCEKKGVKMEEEGGPTLELERNRATADVIEGPPPKEY